jgi:hypothetical protein
MRGEPLIDKLSDEFGQYEILLTCKCGHTRRVFPRTLAAIAGWDARFVDVVKRLRCSKSGKRECEAKVHPIVARRGRGTSH